MQTTRLFVVYRQMYTLLHDTTTFPVHPVTGQPVLVVRQGTGLDDALETVILLAAPEEHSTIEDDSVGMVRLIEQFTYRIAVSTQVDGMSMDDVILRIEELVASIEVAFRSQTTGQPAGPFGDVVAGERNAWKWKIVGIVPDYYETDSGYLGECMVDVEFASWL